MPSTIEQNHQGEEVEVVPANDNTDFNESGSADPKGTAKAFSSDSQENASLNAYSEYKRDPFFAFIPQLARWGCGILTNEAKTVQNGIMSAPGFTKDFLSDTYTYYRAKPRILYKEIVSGFTVAIMQVPESIAFSFVAGVPPLSGLQATWWMAFITG